MHFGDWSARRDPEPLVGPAIRTALQVLMAEPHHKIPNVTLTQAQIRELGL
jgi:hypothetical protein